VDIIKISAVLFVWEFRKTTELCFTEEAFEGVRKGGVQFTQPVLQNPAYRTGIYYL
jgi:hypothetical protein